MVVALVVSGRPRLERRLAGGRLAGPGLEDLAHEHVVDVVVAGVEAGALDGGPDRDAPSSVAGTRAQRPAELADRRARGADDEDLAVGLLHPRSLAPVGGGRSRRASPGAQAPAGNCGCRNDDEPARTGAQTAGRVQDHARSFVGRHSYFRRAGSAASRSAPASTPPPATPPAVAVGGQEEFRHHSIAIVPSIVFPARAMASAPPHDLPRQITVGPDVSTASGVASARPVRCHRSTARYRTHKGRIDPVAHPRPLHSRTLRCFVSDRPSDGSPISASMCRG